MVCSRNCADTWKEIMAGDQDGKEEKKAMDSRFSGGYHDDHGSGDSTPVPVRGIGYMAAEIDGTVLLP